MAVSKQQPDERIDAALAAGQRVFGENRVQEAQARWAGSARALPICACGLIGPLQTNKAEDAVALFDAIDSLDRRKARARYRRRGAKGGALSCAKDAAMRCGSRDPTESRWG